jgi:aminoglycoside phosphotransferase (APT) family kinase protein
VAQASGDFRVIVERSGPQVESRSGAGVHTVRTADGDAAYLKVTPRAVGLEALAAARRELRFYQELAPVVPVRTPRLLDSLDTEEGVAVLLTAAGKPRVAALWTEEMWTSLGRNLAALHGMHVPAAGNWDRPDGLPAAIAAPNAEDINDFWADALPALPTLLSLRVELQARIGVLPPVLVHGDCHVDNIMHGTGSLVFCDWQSAGIGRPVADLAFLSVRATPSGTAVPRVLVDAYLDNSPHDRRTLESALLAEELATLVFLWPPYAVFNSPAGIEHIRRRARDLAERFLADSDHTR